LTEAVEVADEAVAAVEVVVVVAEAGGSSRGSDYHLKLTVVATL